MAETAKNVVTIQLRQYKGMHLQRKGLKQIPSERVLRDGMDSDQFPAQ
jgi:hypothetical protein